MNDFDFETGTDFSRNSFTSSYIDETGNIIENTNTGKIDLLSIPINIRFKFKKGFVISSGMQYDQRMNINKSRGIDSQTGLGINLKFGWDIRIAENISVYIAPKVKVHGILPFYPENYQQRLTEFGLRTSFRF